MESFESLPYGTWFRNGHSEATAQFIKVDPCGTGGKIIWNAVNLDDGSYAQFTPDQTVVPLAKPF